MDPRQQRIQEDLRGLIAGQVLCDDITVQQYATDGSIFEVRPLGVARPVSHEDVVALTKYAREHQLPLIARGSGSGLAGESLGEGLIVDFSHSMNRVLAVTRETITVEPGALLADINFELAKYGRVFGPDPSNRSFGTIGGAVCRDAAGSHWQDYGSVGDQVVGLQLALANSTTIQVGETRSESTSESRAAKLVLQGQVANCRQRFEPLIRQATFATRPAGYRLHQVSSEGEIDLLPLLIGSEGTLAMITEVTLRTVPIPRHRGLVLLFYSRLTDAARVSAQLRQLPIRACDMVDRRLLSLAREADPRYADLIPTGAEAMLLVEAKDDNETRLLDTLSDILVISDGCLGQCVPHFVTVDPLKRNLCWHLVRRIIPTLYRLRGTTRAVPFLEDILVPTERLAEFLVVAQELLNQHRLTASFFSHAAQGRVQIRPLIDLSAEDDLKRLEQFAGVLYPEVWNMGGTIGTHGGLGLSRTPFLRQQAGTLYPAIAEIKRIFDPNFLFNPGKIVRSGFETYFHRIRAVTPQSRPEELAEAKLASSMESTPEETDSGGRLATSGNFSRVSAITAERDASTASRGLPIVDPELNWANDNMAHATRNCNGCGQCRTVGNIERMCPVFRSTRDEAASPRAKANLLRSVVTGQLAVDQLSSEEMRAVTDTCFNCHQCRLDCPAGVDIPKMVNEIRAQYVASNGLAITDRLLLRLDWVFGLARLSPTLTHWLLSQGWSRWVLWRCFGIARQRKLPRFHGRTFLAWAKRRRLNRPLKKEGRRVVLFVDAFVNWNDPELGRALVAILSHHNVSVHVPPQQMISGLSLLTGGAVRPAKRLALHNVRLLAEQVRLGATVLTIEPAATLALKHEYLNLLDDEDARLVAGHTKEATEYLWQLHQEGKLRPEFQATPVSIGHHQPCHQRATVVGNPGLELLRLIPEIQVQPLQKGCSGMAGMYGVFEQNYRTSLRIGSELMREIRKEIWVAGTTECSSCRLQMEQDAEKPTVHPLKIIAKAYGLMPELQDLFERKTHPNFLS